MSVDGSTCLNGFLLLLGIKVFNGLRLYAVQIKNISCFTYNIKLSSNFDIKVLYIKGVKISK